MTEPADDAVAVIVNKAVPLEAPAANAEDKVPVHVYIPDETEHDTLLTPVPGDADT